jgi:hypothetical protein
MLRRVFTVLAAAIVCNNLSLATAAAKPPPAGVLVPGQSLGGLRLGMTPAQVKAAWGGDFGRCRNCVGPTWYYNYAPFTPQGAGVEFRDGRVAAVFTLRAPAGWHTTKRLRIGDSELRVTQLYGALPKIGCTGYDAITLVAAKVTTTFYVQDAKVFGFGLSRAEVPVCR